jgi:tetratricopeptide (TPR) repeat protein
MERIDEALKYLQIGRKADPDSSELNNLLAYAYALKGENLDEALKLVNLALITNPDSVAYLDTLGWIYYRMGDIDKAYSVFHQLELRLAELPKAPGIEDIYYHLGIIYENMGKIDTAIDYYRQGLKLNPVNPHLTDKKKLWEK